MSAPAADPARLITAASFRDLMAKLGPRKGDIADLPPVANELLPPIEVIPEIVPAPVEALAEDPSVEWEVQDLSQAPAQPATGYDWGNSFQSPGEAPRQSLDEPEQFVPPPAAWEPAAEPDPHEEFFEAASFEPEVSAEFDSYAEDPLAEPGETEPPLPVITIDLNAVLNAPDLEGSELVDSLSERLGGGSPLLRRAETSTDPFARPVPGFQERRPVDFAEPDAGTEDVARSLLDIMSAPSGTSQPHERALAADTLLRLAPRLVSRTLVAIAERVSVMENPPPLLVGTLLRDPRDEVARPLLERASLISDQDLMGVIAEGHPAKQRMIARRRAISPALADALTATGEPSVLMNLVRNVGAAFSQDAFVRLCAMARDIPSLQAPLATRPDTPPPIAFELFWIAPPDLRRLVLSRFLTDSETLSRILKLSMTVGGDGTTEAKLPPKQKVEELIDRLEAGDEEAAVRLVCEIGSISEQTARRILADRQGEPLVVMLKALGLPRGRLQGVLERLQVCSPPRIAGDRVVSELQAIFDTLSLTKTRVLLTYWDWAVQSPEQTTARPG